jgi:hypothetical protein
MNVDLEISRLENSYINYIKSSCKGSFKNRIIQKINYILEKLHISPIRNVDQKVAIDIAKKAYEISDNIFGFYNKIDDSFEKRLNSLMITLQKNVKTKIAEREIDTLRDKIHKLSTHQILRPKAKDTQDLHVSASLSGKDPAQTSQQATPQILSVKEPFAASADNVKSKPSEQNDAILIEQIKNKKITDQELYQFFKDLDIGPESPYFLNTSAGTTFPTQIAELLEVCRDQSVSLFFKNQMIEHANTRWKLNQDKIDRKAAEMDNNALLKELISYQGISDLELYRFFTSKNIRSNGGWFESGGTQTQLAREFAQVRKQTIAEFYGKFETQKTAPVKDIKTLVKEDPLQYLITLNSHGFTSNETFELPKNVYVLVPHPQGFDSIYMLKSPSHNLTFEEMIYNSPDKFLETTNGGWRLYRPGELIRNVRLIPWSNAKDKTIEFNNWKSRVPKEDVDFVAMTPDGEIPAFAAVPARDHLQNPLKYKGNQKTKIKVFGTSNLQQVIHNLHSTHPNLPIVLIPFTCNADSIHNPSVNCWPSTSNINQLF